MVRARAMFRAVVDSAPGQNRTVRLAERFQPSPDIRERVCVVVFISKSFFASFFSKKEVLAVPDSIGVRQHRWGSGWEG
jgi:hypothetical protein